MRKHWPLAIAVLVHLALRLAILHTSFDATAVPMYEIYPPGTMAKLLVDGPRLPPHLFYDHAGAEILTGLLMAPLFALFGESYFVVKCVPLAFGLLLLIAIHRFVRAHFGARAANLAAFLFALSPVTMTKFSVSTFAGHFENILFTMLVLLAFYRLHDGAVRRTLWLGLTAFAAGFGLFVFLGTPIMLGLLALVHLAVSGLRRSARDLLVVVPCFVAGLGPWLYLEARTGSRGLVFLDNSFRARGQQSEGAILQRFTELVGTHARDAGCFETFAGIPGEIFSWAFFAAFLVSFAVAVAATVRAFRTGASPFERWRLVPLLGILPLTALAYAMSGLHIANYQGLQTFGGYRYLLPHLLVAILLIAIAAGSLLRSRVLAVVVGALALASGLSNLALVEPHSPARGAGLRYEGYDIRHLARLMTSPGNGLTPEAIETFAAGLQPVFRHQLDEGLGMLAAVRRDRSNEPLTAPMPDAAGAPERAVDLARGIGWGLQFLQANLASAAARPLVEQALLEPARRGDPLAGYYAEGACIPIDFPTLAAATPGLLAANDRVRSALPRELTPALWRGQGLVCGRLLRRGIEADVNLIAAYASRTVDPAGAPFFAGLGYGLADGAVLHAGEPLVPAAFARVVPQASRQAVLEGVGRGLRHVHGPEGIAAALDRARAELDAEAFRAVERGAAEAR